MRRYKTFCVNCGKETRNSPNYLGKSVKPIDYCSICIKEAKQGKKKEEKIKRKEIYDNLTKKRVNENGN